MAEEVSKPTLGDVTAALYKVARNVIPEIIRHHTWVEREFTYESRLYFVVPEKDTTISEAFARLRELFGEPKSFKYNLSQEGYWHGLRQEVMGWVGLAGEREIHVTFDYTDGVDINTAEVYIARNKGSVKFRKVLMDRHLRRRYVAYMS
jgi:hypothetical protein|tara:strand:- start:29777 stop:30223 length:447 start_codon:yes stop_codon:yes gene_type:complete